MGGGWGTYRQAAPALHTRYICRHTCKAAELALPAVQLLGRLRGGGGGGGAEERVGDVRVPLLQGRGEGVS